jgi:hypothetical protein
MGIVVAPSGTLLLVVRHNVVDLLPLGISSGNRNRARLAVRCNDDVVRRHHLALQLVLDVISIGVELLKLTAS